MSYRGTRVAPRRTELGMMNTPEDGETGNINNLYTTKIDLMIRNPQKENTFPVLKPDTNCASEHGQCQVEQTTNVTNNIRDVDCSNSVTAGDSSDAGIETRSCGKISSLIHQFNNVDTNPNMLTGHELKIPAKKLRMGLMSITHNQPNNLPDTRDTASTIQNVTSPGKIQSEHLRLPVVKLNFKMQTEDGVNLPKENRITTKNSPFNMTTVITQKPLVKPRSFKGVETHGPPTQPRDNQTRDIPCADSSAIQHVDQSYVDVTFKFQTNECDSKVTTDLQPNDSLISDHNQSADTKKPAVKEPQTQIVSSDAVCLIYDAESNKAANTVVEVHGDGTISMPVPEQHKMKDDAPQMVEISTEGLLLAETARHTTRPPNQVTTSKTDLIDTGCKLSNDYVTIATPVASNRNIDISCTVPMASEMEAANSNLLNSDTDKEVTKIKDNLENSDTSTVSVTDIGVPDVGGNQIAIAGLGDDHALPSGNSYASNNIDHKLDLLKSELMAMRKMDLVLLRQLINISQTIQRIQRADVPKVSKSLTFLNPNKPLQRRYRPVERQNSAPHCADRRRFLFSNIRSNTEDDYRDSMSSLDESEFDSAQSEVEESTSSLNSILTNSPRSAANRRKFFQSRDLMVSFEVSEDGEQNYEDILRRNVKLWKMSFNKHPSVEEEVDVWF